LKDFHDFYLKVESAHKNEFFEPEIKFDDDVKPDITFEDIKVEQLVPIQDTFDDRYSSSDDEPIKRKPRKSTKLKKRSRRDESEASELETDDKKDPYAAYDQVIREYMEIRCVHCFKEFDSFIKMAAHCKKAHNDVGYMVCCEKKFKRRLDIYRHILEHKFPQEKLICDQCNKKFKTGRILKIHKQEVHTDESERQFACDKCPKRFYHHYNLKQHLASSHIDSTTERSFICSFENCGKAFINKNRLKLHEKGHDQSYEIVCDICSKVLRGKGTFEQHLKTHDESYTEKKEQCNICGAWVRRLKKHQASHVMLDLECNYCGKVVHTKNALTKHISYYHKAARSFECSFCNKTFKKKESLKEHIAGHTGDTLYTCPYCPSTFNSSANMHRHKKRDHREQWLKSKGTKCIMENDIQDILQVTSADGV
jgi:hypothetical protein